MKICIASNSNGGLEDTVSMQFGRCPTFTVVEIEGNSIKNAYVIPNPGASAASGAGMQAGQAVVNEGCKVLIAGAIGPNSAQVLTLGGVEMRTSPEIKVKDAVEKYMKGELPIASVSEEGMGAGGGMGRGMGRGRHGRRRRNW